MPEFAMLTAAQATLLREHRRRLALAAHELNKLVYLFVDACPHVDDEFPETCHLCSLYQSVAGAYRQMQDVPDRIDLALKLGPRPGKP